MKLYSTIESERAKKRQGGNKYIDIKLYSGSSLNSNLDYKIIFKWGYIKIIDNNNKIVFLKDYYNIKTKGKK